MATPTTDASKAGRRWIRRLLVPHVLAAAAFIASAAAESAAGTNRSALDFNLATAGFILGVVAMITTVVAAALFPWRHSSTVDWVWLLLHALGLVMVVQLASNWMGGHIA